MQRTREINWRREAISADALKPTTLEIVVVCVLAGLYVAADTFIGGRSYSVLNIAGPITMSVILAWAAWSPTRTDGRHLWTPLFWFRVSTVVYFCIGTYLVFFIEASARTYLESLFWFFDADVFKLNLIVSVSVALVLLSARVGIHLSARVLAQRDRRAPFQEPEQNLIGVALPFLLIGFALNLAIKVPYDFGWLTVEVPGFLMNLTRLRFVGIFLITLWCLRERRGWLPVIVALVGLELFSQVLLFSKADFLLALILFLLAFLWNKVTIKSLAFSAALVVALFGGLQPIVAAGRYQLEQRYGSETQAGFVERYEIIREYVRSTAPFENGSEGSSALTRLSYVNGATLVIDRYDSGFPGDWPSLIPAVFVPRILWSDKPIITDIGRDIYELGTGRRTSQSGAGLFADAYWAMGWFGVALFMPIYGLILGLLTTTSARILHRGQWLYMPIVLMALRLGVRTDGHYLADVAGGTVILVATFGGLWLLEKLMKWSVVPRRAVPLRTTSR
jgi:hypothetical protein